MGLVTILGLTVAGAAIGALTMTGVGAIVGVSARGPTTGGAFAAA